MHSEHREIEVVRHNFRSGSVSSHVVELASEYADFFASRERDKKRLYTSVAFTGWSLLCSGLVFMFLILGVVQPIVGGLLYTSSYVLFVVNSALLVGVLLAITGVVVFSSVPVDAFELDLTVTDNPILSRVAAALTVITVALWSLSQFAFAPPYMGWIMLFLCAFVLLELRKNYRDMFFSFSLEEELGGKQQRQRWTFATKLSVFFSALGIPIGCAYVYRGADPAGYVQGVYLFSAFESEWRDMCVANIGICRPFYVINGVFYFLYASLSFSNLVWNLYTRPRKGWRTSSLYYTVYLAMTAVGCNWTCSGFFMLLRPLTISVLAPPAWFQPLGCGLALLFPMAVILLVIGRDRFFLILARRFDTKIQRMLEDGAFLAELASKSQVLSASSGADSNQIRWVKRAHTDNRFLTNKINKGGFIDRAYWMKGRILNTRLSPEGSATLDVEVSFVDDAEHGKRFLYKGSHLEEIRSSSKSGRSSTKHSAADEAAGEEENQGDEFALWLAANFGSSPAAASTTGNDPLVVVVEEKMKQQAFSRQELLTEAEKQARRFCWSQFKVGLLEKSPRELVDDEERKEVFELSTPFSLAHQYDRADFFISHSWSDNPQHKTRVLCEFAAAFKQNTGRSPTVWFDKTCIDQRAPDLALTLLPVFIASSKKMIVVLSESYLTRLWCLWEIFTLLSFSNKELALERIIILPLDDRDDDDDDGMTDIEGQGVVSWKGGGGGEGESASSRKTRHRVENRLARQERLLRMIPDMADDAAVALVLDRAHCFDPNEELKLRRIMLDVGMQRLREGLREIKRLLEEIIKRS